MQKIQNFPLKIVNDLPPKINKTLPCALDTEWFNMEQKRMHRPTGHFAWLGCTFDGKTVYYVTEEDQIQPFMDRIEQGVHIYHNMKFDVFHIRRYADYPDRKKIWDIFLMEKILFSGYYDAFALDDLARRWLHVYMDKEVRKQFEKATELTEERIEYACYDVIPTWHIAQKQRKHASETDKRVWREIDKPGLWAVMNMMGMRLDKEAWTKIADENKKKFDALCSKYPTSKTGISLLNSSQQVGKKLIQEGYTQLPKTPTGRPKTDVKTLERIKNPSQFVLDKLEHSSVKTLVSTYGYNFLDHIESDGRIWANFKLNQAATGRFSCTTPNLENIPKVDKYRKCFIAGEGNVLIALDYSAQEPRILAHFSQDEKLIEIFKSGEDIYIEAAKLMFGWELTKKDPRRNELMKPTVIGASYGMSEYGLEKEKGIPIDQGRKLLDAFWGVFTGAKKWTKKQQKIKTYVETIYGRKFWLNLHLFAGKAQRNSINSPVQGSAGDMVKIAMFRIQDWYGWDRKLIVNTVHDEVVLEVPEDEGEKVMEKATEIMVAVGDETHPSIPCEVSGGIGQNWAVKA